MGACQCEGTKLDEAAVNFTPRPGIDRAFIEEKQRMQLQVQLPTAVAAKAGVPLEILRIQGTWQTEMDKQVMGTITGTNIIWDPVFNHNQSELRVVGTSLEMELMGATHIGVYEEPNRIRWSDGEYWLRA
mmetsp:Transcript_48826/g.79262  ORF Transcript_48826/g.79262 Transcript_48826/m.79262 type:complete len:130 (+) Transcript_48826:65-454(+)